MIEKIVKKINKIKSINFRFDLPSKKKILQYDELNSEILKKTISKDFNILRIREKKEIYFWIFLKQIIFFDFKLNTYYKNYIKFTTPKIIITTVDNLIEFYELKKSFKNINFISIQNGIRLSYWFKNKIFDNYKDLRCDYIFVFNEYLIKEYEKKIKSKFYVLGSFKNNIINIGKTKIHNQFLYISGYGKNQNKELHIFQKKLLNSINLYCLRYKKKLHILIRGKSLFKQEEEIQFYKKIFHSNCVFYRCTRWDESYKILDKFENIIFTNSTMGYEAIARKKKVAIFSPKKHKNFEYHFGWPAPFQKRYLFFSSTNLVFNEVKRVLDNVYNCSQSNWEKKYFHLIKDQMYIDFKNKKLVKVIKNILENS